MFIIERGITDEASREMAINICRKDRLESTYFTTCLQTYINGGVANAGAHCITIRDAKGRLCMLAGVSPAPAPEGEEPNPEHAVGWILKTKQLRIRNKEDKKAMAEVLAECIHRVRTETDFKRIGNAIHANQTASLNWMQRTGFTISWDNPGIFYNNKHKPGIFYQFMKEI